MKRILFHVTLALFALLTIASLESEAQHLKRKAAIGAQLSQAPSGTVGVKVDAVTPGLTGEKIGLRKDDILTGVNGRDVADVPGALAVMRTLYEGESASLVVRRDGKSVTLTGTFTGRPQETAPGLEVIYTETLVGGEYRRSVIQKPTNATGKLPAVLFIQGIYCSPTVDLPAGHPYYELLTPIAQKGYVVFRVERSGLSDSEGKPCGQLGFLDELAGYKAALKQLQALPYVDASRVYILGHSMGGVMAPLVAADQNVKGVITYGTAARLWSLYEIENVFDQGRIPEKVDYVELEADVRRHQKFVHMFYGQKMKPEDIVKQHPDLKDYFAPDGTYASRHYSFFHELNDVEYAAHWKRTTAKVLVLYGENDFQTTADNNRFIAEMVNAFHPGAAEFKILPKIDHSFQTTSSKRESVELLAKRDYSRFNRAVVDEILAGLARMS
jgi:dienelactone hydrolase